MLMTSRLFAVNPLSGAKIPVVVNDSLGLPVDAVQRIA